MRPSPLGRYRYASDMLGRLCGQGAQRNAGCKKVRRTLLLLTAAVVLTLVASGVALAARINCPNVGATNDCVGTKKNDRLLGSAGPDNMTARRGDDGPTHAPHIP
jgi:hypothetical protein